MRDENMERKLQFGLLLEFYGGFLTERQRAFLDLHHNQDLSLVEIAEHEGISRQGVHDAIRRGEASLLDMEERLGLAGKFQAMTSRLEDLDRQLRQWQPDGQADCDRKTHWLTLTHELVRVWED